jgi:hypothetical protein
MGKARRAEPRCSLSSSLSLSQPLLSSMFGIRHITASRALSESVLFPFLAQPLITNVEIYQRNAAKSYSIADAELSGKRFEERSCKGVAAGAGNRQGCFKPGLDARKST